MAYLEKAFQYDPKYIRAYLQKAESYFDEDDTKAR
jgi:Tfp pilus assembly protein PilF